MDYIYAQCMYNVREINTQYIIQNQIYLYPSIHIYFISAWIKSIGRYSYRITVCVIRNSGFQLQSMWMIYLNAKIAIFGG